MLKNPSNLEKRKNLVWVQIGPGSEFSKWFDREAPRNFDVLCNWYSFDSIDLSLSEYAFGQRGTKFTSVAKIMELYPEVFANYDRILFLDDDLIFTHSEVSKLFDDSERFGLNLFQAGLTQKSHCIWPVLKSCNARECIPVNSVEIMMPGFDQETFQAVAPLFRETVSGFGLDLAYGKVAMEKGLNAGVVCSVQAKHFKPINTDIGLYYSFMRENQIHPKLELWYFHEKYRTELAICEIG